MFAERNSTGTENAVGAMVECEGLPSPFSIHDLGAAARG